MTDQIQVLADAPAFPLILADTKFLATLAGVEEQVATLKITDAQSAQHAANLQQRLTSAGKQLDAARLALKRPFIDINAKIDATAREPLDRIEKSKTVLKNALTAYDAEQQRIAAAAEKARQAELARLEKLRLAEEEAARKKADELARVAAVIPNAVKAAMQTPGSAHMIAIQAAQRDPAMGIAIIREIVASLPAQASGVVAATASQFPDWAPQILKFAALKVQATPEPLEIDFDEGPAEPPPKTETEKQIEAVKFAPAAVVQRPQGIAFRVRLIHRVESVAALPETFVTKTANDAAIRATFCAGYREGEPLPVCPGVVFTVEKTPVDTGRRVF